MKNERHDRRLVTRAIKLALTLIAEQDPELGRLLSKSIKTGRYLLYSPASEPSPERKSQDAKKVPPRQGEESLQPGIK